MKTIELLSLVVLIGSPAVLCQTACPVGFTLHGSSCYIFSILRVSWIQAWRFCEMYGASLAAIETEPEQLWIESFYNSTWTKANQTSGIWIGGTDLLVENEWTWAKTLDPIEYSRWAPNKPDHQDRVGYGENCLELMQSANFMWNVVACSNKLNFLCEKPLLGGNTVFG